MSERLPVGAVLNEALQFALKRWGTVIKYGWLPIVLSIAVMLGLVFAIMDVDLLRAAETDPGAVTSFDSLFRAPLGVAAALVAVAAVIVMFLISGFMASVYRLVALGEEREGVFQLRVNGPALRVFWAQIILVIINYAIYAAAFVVAAALGGENPASALGEVGNAFNQLIGASNAGSTLTPEQLIIIFEPFKVFFLAGLLTLIPMLYVNLKLVPFAAGSAAENRLLLFGAFRMTTGHVWSILGIYVLMILLVLVSAIVFGIASEVLQLVATLNFGQSGALAFVATVATIIYVGLTIFYEAFVAALQLSVQAIIYRRLATGA